MSEEINYQETEKMNPFFSIWLSTRETVRYVLDHKELKYSLLLAAIAGIPSAISGASEWSKHIHIALLLAAIIILGPILGLIGLAIGSAIYTWVGKWFGGVGTYKQMVQAMGVMVIPNIWFTPYWILSFILVRNDTFALNYWEISSRAVAWYVVSFLITMTLSVWMIVIQSKGIGEVHQFSSWKGFATLIIPAIVLGIIFFVVIMIIVMFIFNNSMM